MKRNLIVVCGDRNAQPRDWQRSVDYVLDCAHDEFLGTLVVVEGGAEGIDTIVRNTCDWEGIPHLTAWALWITNRRAAGPQRNRLMADLHPAFVWALHDDIAHSKGTLSMVKIAKKLHIPFQVVSSKKRVVILPPELGV